MNDPLDDMLRRHLSALDGVRLPDAEAVAHATRLATARHHGRARARASAGAALILAVLVTVGVLAVRGSGSGRSVVTGSTTERSVPPTDGPLTTLVPEPSWRAVAVSPRPHALPLQVVWTGTEAITIGGGDSYGADVDAYDPATDRWRPVARQLRVAVPIAAWTGDVVLLVGWDTGRLNTAAFLLDVSTGELTVGAVMPFGYKAAPGVPYAWTGDTLLMLTDHGAIAYDVAADEWRPVADAPIEARTDAASVWTGSEWLVWGGSNLTGDGNFADGAAYDPATDRWRTLGASPLSGRLVDGVWSGSELLVMAGRSSNANGMFAFADGAAYDPATDRWRLLAEGPAHPGFHLAFDGTTVYLFAKGGVATYDLATDRWSAFVTVVPCHSDDTPLWTGSALLALGCADGSTGGAVLTGGR